MSKRIDMATRDDASLLGAPWMWPRFPFIQVERRSIPRPGQPFCIVFADETGQVLPAVFFVDEFPPLHGTLDPVDTQSFSYISIEALVADGWTVVEDPAQP